MKIGLGIASLLAAGLSAAVSADELVRYEMPGGDFNPTFVASGFSANALNTDGASSGSIEPGIALPDSLFHRFGGPLPTPSTAIGAGQFFAFTLDTQVDGAAVEFSRFQMDAGRGGSTGLPRGYALQWSVDGFSSILGTEEVITTQPTMLTYTVDLPAGAQTGEITFRVFSYGNAGTGAGMFYDNITVLGTADACPPNPNCPPDWNCDGVVDSDDLFEFLADWAAGDADYNGDGVTDSDDLFEFLSDWAAGC